MSLFVRSAVRPLRYSKKTNTVEAGWLLRSVDESGAKQQPTPPHELVFVGDGEAAAFEFGAHFSWNFVGIVFAKIVVSG